MNQHEKILFLGFIAFYLPTFGLFQLMIFRVNQHLPPERRIPHSLYLQGWNRLSREYKGFYPKSFLYQFTVIWAATCLFIAVGFAGFRFWEYAMGR